MTTCEHCHRQILWVMGPRGGFMPVDANPSPDGTVAVQRGEGGVLHGGTVTRGQAGGMRAAGKQLHTPHRITCEHADRWAKGHHKEPRYRSRR